MRSLLAGLLLLACAPADEAPREAPPPPDPHVLAVERGQLLDVALGADRLVATSSNDRVRAWSLPAGELLDEARGHRRGVTTVALAPDGRVLTGGPDRTVRVWSAALEEALVLRGPARPVADLAFAPGGDLVAATLGGELFRWSPAGEERLAREGPAQRGVMALALSADGARLAWAADGGNLRVWDTASGAKLAGLRADGVGFVAAVALAPAARGTLVATGARDTPRVAVWDLGRQALVAECRGVSGPPRALAFAPDGLRLAVASEGGHVQLFDARTGAALHAWRVAAQDHARRLAFDPAGARLAAAGPGPRVTWFDVRGLPAPADVVQGPPLDAPLIRAEGAAEDASFPEDGRIDLARLALPGYDPPELRADPAPLVPEAFPPRVRVLAGREVTATGYPLASESVGGEATRFLLSRFPPGCCFGAVPVPDEWVEVTVEEPLVLDPERPVEVTGALEVGEVIDELGFAESLYRMRAEAVRPAR